MSLGWSVALPAGSDQSSSSSSHEDPNDEHPEDALPAPLHFRWRRDALQRSQVQQDGGLRCVTWNTRGLIGYPFSSLTSKEKQHNDSVYLPEATTSDEFLHAPSGTGPRVSCYVVRLYQRIRTQVVQQDAFIRTSCLMMPMVTHVVTCQGCDHIRSGCRSLVVVNVHFEHELDPENLALRDYVSSHHTGLNILTPLQDHG